MGAAKEHWTQIRALLDELIDADAAHRHARLSEVRTANPALADEVASLLDREAVAEAEGFLDGSVLDGEVDLTGRKVGAYTLERLIGHGGMGAVWLARRSDGRFEGTVAVKFLNLALLAGAGAERFQREGRLLARLAHPNIARLIDAGVDGGQPYLVLEYVEGDAIDRWCDCRRLGIEARIRLFLDVLAAVAHAHGQLVLHRDVKPANILVTPDGVVKLLDFGIATLLDASDVPQTALTAAAGPAFTPGYASPEQVQAGELTMASDVYALGVLLSELLTGRHPTASDARTPVDQLRALIENEARRLSDSAGSLDATVAANRAVTPRRLVRALRGDLDNIAAKALKKSAAERYQTVAAFADDLRRWLNHEPVAVRADSLAYRAGRFVRRNRLAVGAAAAVAVALIAGTVTTTWQAREAARQRDLALTQLGRAETASDFVAQMLDRTWGADERISRAEFLGRSEALALRELSGKPEQQSVVLQALAGFYGSLGDYGRAEPLARQAISLLPASADPSWRASVECRYALDQWLTLKGDAGTAALTRWMNDSAVEPATAAVCAGNLAKIALNSNDAQTALRHSLKAQALMNASPRRTPVALASIHSDLGYSYALNGRGVEADREYSAALDIYKSIDASGSPSAIAVLNNWSTAAVNAGDMPRGLSLFDEVIRLAVSSSAGTDAPPYALANRAAALLAMGRYDDAITQASAARRVSVRANNKTFETSAVLSLAGARMERGDLNEADRLLAEAASLSRELPPDSTIPLVAGLRRGRLALLRGDYAGAATSIQPVIALLESRGIRNSTMCIALRVRSESAAHTGDRAAAVRDADAALAIAQRLQGERPFSLHTGLSWLLLAQLRSDAGDADGARMAGRNAAEQLGPMLPPQHRDVRLARDLASR